MTLTYQTAVRARALVVRQGDRVLVGPLSFEQPRGTTMGLQGPSGSGKSTALRALVGLLPAGVSMTGEVETLGQRLGAPGVDMPGLRAKAVLVGQSPVVLPTSILGNAAFGVRHVLRASRAQLRERAEAALVEAGLWSEVADRLDAPAEQLSVGQRQRLCLARALALDPDLLLLDEPTSALDAAAVATVEDAITSLQGRTVLIVSHDQAQLRRLCSMVINLEDGDRAGQPEAVPAGHRALNSERPVG